MNRLKRLYEILETPFGASLEETQRRYRDLAVVWHPDRFAHNSRLQATALEKLKEINGAYNELTAYLKQHGPPSPSSLKRERKEKFERADRKKERTARAESQARTVREKAVTPLGMNPLIRVLIGVALLIACLTAGYLLIPGKKPVPEMNTLPARIVSPPPEGSSSPAAEAHPKTVLQPPTPPSPTPQPKQATSPPLPSPKPLPPRPTEEAPPHEMKQEPPPPARSAPVPDSTVTSVTQRAFERCRVHSPADWCGRVVERCREYLRECRRLSVSDSSYRESAECRGVQEWCYNVPRSVIHLGTDEEEQGLGTE
jgi:hypothetical protein